MTLKSTIFAVSSGSGRAGIAVVRLSGPAAFETAVALTGCSPEPRRAYLRTIRTFDQSSVIDVGLLLFFKGPHSATGEDVVEFHVHGSPAVLSLMLSELSKLPNLKMAEAGAFSRRAFENGRLDLVEIEGLADLLAAETESQRRLAMRQFSGEASSVYESWRSRLLDALAFIEASIDFADEEGVAVAAIVEAGPRIAALLVELSDALAKSSEAAAVRRGLRITIAGAPNVGKSSLLNALVGRDAAIVSEIAGTTRDVVEAAIVLGGLPVSIADTAGLRDDSLDAIELQGMARSKMQIADADILIWVSAFGHADLALPPRQPDLHVLNKCDLSIHLRNDAPEPGQFFTSVQQGTGLAEVKQALEMLLIKRSSLYPDAVVVRERHRQAIAESIRYLNDATGLGADELELMAENVRKAAQCLESITGRIGVEDLLGRIFQEFCIGK